MSEIDVSRDLTLAAGNCTAGFVDSEANPPLPLGSGTLISFGDLKGILTCAHVLEAISKRRRIGLVVFCRGPEKPQGLRVQVDQCDIISIAGETWSDAGPDIGFLVLPYQTIEAIGAYATITNGDKRRIEFASKEPESDISFFSISGGVAEWTTVPIDNEVQSVTQFNALNNIGKIRPTSGAEGFDFVEFEATPDQTFQLPRSYGGMSGGGLWKLYFKSVDEGLSFVQARLLGVAFFETVHGTIICHGPRSIYEALHSRLPRARAA